MLVTFGLTLLEDSIAHDQHVHLGPDEAVERLLRCADDRLVLVE